MNIIKINLLNVLKPHFFLFTLLLLLTQGTFAAYPQPVPDTVVNDYAGIIKPAERDKIVTLFADLKQRQSIDAVVVTINSIHDYDTGDTSIESFATHLFNMWGIGSQENNNAILLLVAIKDRKVRIEVGADYGDKLNSVMQQVIDEQILPHFRGNAYSEGIYQGAFSLAKLLTASEQESQVPAPQAVQTPAPPETQIPSSETGFIDNAVTWWNKVLFFINLLREDANARLAAGFVGFIVICCGIAFYLRYLCRGIASYLRYRSRQCPHCHSPLIRLDDQAEDVYLEEGQQQEELLASVDYDVWKCPHCNYHALLRYNRFFSSVKTCPECHYKTVVVTQTVLSPATYTAAGREKIVKDCSHCSYHDKRIVTLPKLTRSSSDGGGYSGGGSSSSGGGGSSSGGGASGSW
jgi:uncharacterized protein